MLRLEKVRKQYRDFELDCTMEVQPGCVTGLIGKNGAGKSTAFKASLGLIKLDGGEVKVFGVPVSKLGVKERQNIGVVLSDSGFSGYLSVQDIIPVLGSLYPNFQKGDFIRACEKMQIPLRKQLKEFSTGMKRKLQILAALSHEAKLLILDEPTAGLDIIAREQILDMLREYMEQDDKAILISSHISTDLEGFCDDIYMIDDGKIIFHEEADNLSGSLWTSQSNRRAVWKPG